MSVTITLTDKEFSDVSDALWCAALAHEAEANHEKHVAEYLGTRVGRNFYALMREARRWKYLDKKFRNDARVVSS